MSARNRLDQKQRRRAERRADADPRGYWETSTGWTPDDEGAEAVMANASKMVTDRLGPRRTGPVQYVVKAGDEAREHLSSLRAQLVDLRGPESETMANHYRRLGALLREHGGFIITALAPGFPPDPPAGG